jgi:hypothetical protein
VRVVHVFPEDDQDARAAHLEFWFGYPTDVRGWDREDRAIVCFCGATLFPLARDGSNVLVSGVWHKEAWYDVPIPGDGAQ